MIKKIVLTGGPCAGKTKVLSEIKKSLSEAGFQVYVVSESATELMNGGITPHKDSVGLFNFQRLIMSYQYQKEEIYDRASSMCNDKDAVIIYDRGLMDNKAYITDEEFKNLLKELSFQIGKNIDKIDLLFRYDMVIHLVTSAGNVGYSLESNKARYESEKEAIIMDKKTMDAWSEHSNFYVVKSTYDFNDKINCVLNLIHNYLSDESLRKCDKTLSKKKK